MPPPDFPEKLSHAPLVYVLAQVQTDPRLKLESYIPDIQEMMRRAYPQFDRNVIRSFQFGPGEAPSVDVSVRFGFASKARDTGFVLAPDSLVFHTTSYDRFPDFLAQSEKVLATVHEVLDFSLVKRIGLRYVDVVVPQGSDKPSDYVCQGLSGFPVEGFDGAEALTRTQTIVNTELGRLVMRYTETREGTVLPEDLGPAPPGLKLSKTASPGQLVALLDFDHYSQEQLDFSVEAVLRRLDALHEKTSAAFKRSVSEQGLSVWR